MSVTAAVVTCVYGDYDRFVPEWWRAVKALERKPDAWVVAGDRNEVLGAECPWRYPHAFYLQRAIEAADTDWVWIVDIDDQALPDALNGIDDVQADVWMMGYEQPDGDHYIPLPMTAADVLAARTSLIPAGSAIRTEAYHACGGFQDIALQDWGLWRALARNGATFESSGRTHYRYNSHPGQRHRSEQMDLRNREAQIAEMLDTETVAA